MDIARWKIIPDTDAHPKHQQRFIASSGSAVIFYIGTSPCQSMA
jgi:hypothetical protein